MISLLRFIRNISKYHFSGERVLLNSIMDIHYSTAEGGADQNRMAVHVRGGAVIWSFWFVHCMYQSYCRLIIYRFQIHLLLLVYKLYSFFFVFVWIQQYFKKYTKKPVTKIYVTSCAGKTLCRKCFDTVKLHSRVPGGIFRIFVLEMVIRMHPW